MRLIIVNTLFEAQFADADRIFKPKLIFRDGKKSPQIIRHLKEKFHDHSVDEKLNKKTNEQWIKKGLPVVRVSPTSNITRIPIEVIMRTRFDPLIEQRIKELEENAKKHKKHN